MTYDFIIDSHAWVEYFRGSEKGKKVEAFIEGSKSATPTIVLGELSALWNRENIKTIERDFLFITSKTAVIELSAEIAVTAGAIKNAVRQKYKDKKKFGLADAIILATARNLNARVLSGNTHFEGLVNVEFLD